MVSTRCEGINAKTKNRCKNRTTVGKLCHQHRPKPNKIECGFELYEEHKYCKNPVKQEGERCHFHGYVAESKDKARYTCGAINPNARGRKRGKKCMNKVYEEDQLCYAHRVKEAEEVKGNTKKCQQCHKLKTLNEFGKRPKGTFGREAVCKKCRADKRKRRNYPRVTTGLWKCRMCGDDKPPSAFGTEKFLPTGIKTACMICLNTYDAKCRSELDAYTKKLFSSIKSHAKDHSLPLVVSITQQDITDMYEKSNICKRTGLPMYHKVVYDSEQLERYARQHYYNFSVDRIDSSKGYVKENVQLVRWWYNSMKWDLSDEILIEWARKVARYQRHLRSE